MKRVLLKLSGEALAGDKKTGFDEPTVVKVAKQVKELAEVLIDIHGQHEHQSLMKVTEHRKFLDSYAGLTETVARFTLRYSLLVEKRKLLASLAASDKEKNQKIDLLSFAVKEIEEAKLKITMVGEHNGTEV